ncbi:short-chain dehydrogenase/reductase sdr [Hyaloraphidium curvatum]|nr:short-chain dehydrogenase/reductase sdr [Hyaloraphidium curvatum]
MPKVVIAGVSGLVGHAAAERFAAAGFDVVGVSRRVPTDLDKPGITLLSVDLTDAQKVADALGKIDGVTHVVYAALLEKPGLFEGWIDEDQIELNGTMLRNFFEPLAAKNGSSIKHVSLLHGTKAYGIHHPSLGYNDVHIPLRERDPRRPHRNFYFVQEDYLHERQKQGDAFALTVWRPTVIYGDAGGFGANMNPVPAIAVYAALLREKGEPLHKPWADDGSHNLQEAVDADLVADALVWAADAPSAAGGTFNLTNGDVFLWPMVWPAIAETLGMEVGEHRPFSFAKDLPQQDAEWAAIVKKYSLRAPPSIMDFVGLNSLVYSDMLLGGGRRQYAVPALNSTIAARKAGFGECMDSEDMFRKWFGLLVERNLLPAAPAKKE